MKIRTKSVDFSYLEQIERPRHKRPQKPWGILGAIIRLISLPDLWATSFSYKTKNMHKAGKGPYLILMNHSSFIDLEIAYKIFWPKPFSIVAPRMALLVNLGL